METPIIGGDDAGGEAGLIKETSTQNFVADVIEASREALVLVDFWAPWCGPCKQLTPLLEKTVKATGGKARLVKLNIDEHPSIPGQLGIQSIPAVFAFKNGQPVDAFMGALPESQIKQFIDRLLGPEAKAAETAELDTAKQALEAGDYAAAAQAFAQILQKDSANAEAIGGLAQCYVKSGDLDRAEETLALARPQDAETAAISAARAMIDLARKSGGGGDAEALRARVESNPDDLQARFDLAIALNAADDRQGAAEQLLAIIAADRDWNEGAARDQLLQFFDAWGAKDPATVSARQKLSSLLFS